MNYIKRAYFSLTRRWVRTLILVIVFTVIAALLFSGISISNAAQKTADEAKATVGSEVTVSWKSELLEQQHTTVLMTSDELSSLAAFPGVNDYNFIRNSYSGVADDFSVTGNEKQTQENQKERREWFIKEGHPEYAEFFREANISVYGVRKSNLCDQFVSGGYQLVSGRALTEKDFGNNVLLMSKVVADKNHLRVGDTVHLDGSANPAHYPFTVVGIFTTPKPASKYVAQNSQRTPYNNIFIPYTQVGLLDNESGNFQPFSLDNTIRTVNFYLDDPAKTDEFVAYSKKLVGTNYIAETNDDLYKAAVQPLSSVASAAQLLTAFTLIAGGLIFALIIVFSLRGRNHEFGVLLAIGEKKVRILLQMLLEVLFPVLIAFFIGAASGGMISGIIGNNMISQRAAAAQQQQNNLYISQHVATFFGFVGKTKVVSPIKKIDMSVSPENYGLLAGACILITLVSVAVPCVSILRYKPKQILQQK